MSIWRFRSEMQVGDVIIANKAKEQPSSGHRNRAKRLHSTKGRPRRSPAAFAESGMAYHETRERAIQVLSTHRHGTQEESMGANQGCVSEQLSGRFGNRDSTGDYQQRDPYPGDSEIATPLETIDGGGVTEEPGFLQELRSLLARTRNLIVYGPPGCGKTYLAGPACEGLCRCGADEIRHLPPVVRLRGVRGRAEAPAPQEGDAQIKYGVVPACSARCVPGQRQRGAHRDAPKYLLVIDEINRANIAKVLGRIHHTDRGRQTARAAERDHGHAALFRAEFGVPPNLYILGTMNTADRSIALLDLALRRRFTFMELMPNPSLLSPVAGVDLSACWRA